MADDKIKKLYDTFVSEGYEMESEDEFRKNITDPTKRRAAYDALVGDGYEMEPFEEFDRNIGEQPQQSQEQIIEDFFDQQLGTTSKDQAPQSREEIANAFFGHPWMLAKDQDTQHDSAANPMWGNLYDQEKKQQLEEARKYNGSLSRDNNNPWKWEAPSESFTDYNSLPKEQPKQSTQKENVAPQPKSFAGALDYPEYLAQQEQEQQAQKEYEITLRSIIDPQNTVSVDAAKKAWDKGMDKYIAEADEIKETYTSPWMDEDDRSFMIRAQMASRLKNLDMSKLSDYAWNALGDNGKKQIISELAEKLHKRYPGANPDDIYTTAKGLARQQTDKALYDYAVEQNAPKSKIEFLFRKIMDTNMLYKLEQASARSVAGSTGDMQASDDAMGKYGKDHRIANVTGTVLGMATDPTTYIGGAAGKLAGKTAMNVGGRILARTAGKTATKAVIGAGTRLFGSKMAGKVITGMASSAGNLATYEAIGEALSQAQYGGHINPETGEIEDYSLSAIAGAFGHGAMMGATIGWLSPVSGSLTSRLSRGTRSTWGKVGWNVAVPTTAMITEGTIFAAPDLYNIATNDNLTSEEKKQAMWDAEFNSMALMLGFKAQHMFGSASSMIADAFSGGRAGFETKLRARLDGHPDLAFTKDELAELQEYGYDNIFWLARNHESINALNDMSGDLDKVQSTMNKLVDDKRVSEATRAKAFYFATGSVLPMSPITYGKIDKDGNTYIVKSYGENGVITSRRFTSEKQAELELSRIEHQAELNLVSIGEQKVNLIYNTKEAFNDVAKTYTDEYGVKYSPEELKLYYQVALLIDPKDRAESHNNLIEEFNKAIARRQNDTEGAYHIIRKIPAKDPDNGRKFYTQHYIDEALAKEPYRRNEEERYVVKEYLRRLNPNEAQERAQVEEKKEDARVRGYNAEDSSEKNNIQVTYDERTHNLRVLLRVQGIDTDEWLGDDPISKAMELRQNGASEEQVRAILDYVEAKAAHDGVIQKAQDDIKAQADAASAEIDKISNTDTGEVVVATLKDDTSVNIITGNIRPHEDGSIDYDRSDKDIIVRDAKTGEEKFVPISEVLSITTKINAEDAKKQAKTEIAEQIAQKVSDGMDGVLPFNQGDTYELTDDDGKRHTAQVVANYGNGIVDIIMDGEQRPVTMKAEDVQRMADNTVRTRIKQQEEERKKSVPVSSSDVETDPENDSSRKIIGRSLSENEAKDVIAIMSSSAEVAPTLELTPYNWLSEFGEDGKIQTPIGEVKMGENQYYKLARQGREGKLGMVKPTLVNPDVIVEDYRPAKDGSSERDTSYVFIKAFTKEDGSRLYYFTSITVAKDGKEVVISNQEKNANKISKLLQNGTITWIKPYSSLHPKTQNEKPVSLDDSSTLTNNGNQSTSLGISSPAVFEDKVSNNPANLQKADEKTSALDRIPKDKKGNPQFESVPVSDTWEALVEMNEGNDAEALDTVKLMVENSKKEYDKISKRKPGGSDVMEIQKNKAKKKAELKEAEDKLSYWQQVADFKEKQLTTTDREVEEETPNVEQTEIAAETIKSVPKTDNTLPENQEEIEKPEDKKLPNNDINAIFAKDGISEDTKDKDNHDRESIETTTVRQEEHEGDGLEQDNDAQRQADRTGVAERTASKISRDMPRGDIRVFEEGLGSAQREHPEYSERARRDAESQRLVDIAKQNGLYVPINETGQYGIKQNKKTGESVVYLNEQEDKVYKVKNPYAKAAIKSGVQPEDAIYEHIVHNLLFPETPYTFEGISDDLGDVRIVLSQPFIDSYGTATREQIEKVLAERGLYPEDKYSFGNEYVSITDVEGDNVIVGEDAKLYFIDPIINFKKPVKEIIQHLKKESANGQAADNTSETSYKRGQVISPADNPFDKLLHKYETSEAEERERVADEIRSMDIDTEIAEREEGIENLKASIEKEKTKRQKEQEKINAHNQRIKDQLNLLRTEIAKKLGYSESDLSNERKRKNLEKKYQEEVSKNPDGEVARLAKEYFELGKQLKEPRNLALGIAESSLEMQQRALETLKKIRGTHTQRLSQQEAVKPTKEQTLAAEAIVDHIKASGIEVSTDTNEMRSVLEESADRAQKMAIEEANKRFDDQLDAFANGSMKSNEQLSLGFPGMILQSAGIPDKDMRLNQSVLRKHLAKHKLSISDIKGLAKAVQTPIMVYNWGDKAKSHIVITELNTTNGEKVSIAIKIAEDGIVQEVNEVVSVHGKDATYFLNGMANATQGGFAEGLRYVEKEKALDWLAQSSPKENSSADQEHQDAANILENFENPKADKEKALDYLRIPAPIAGAQSDQGLLSAAKVIQDFENPKITNDILQKAVASRSGTSETQRLQTPQGEVYGFVKDGKIYLDPALLNPNTPIHEYSHLWDNAVRKANPELWDRGVKVLKEFDGGALWNEVKNDPNYADIAHDDNLVASEVKSRLTGEKGAKFFEQAARNASQEKDLFEKARKISIIEQAKRWIKEIWDATKQWFASKSAFADKWSKEELDKLTSEDFVNMTLRDLMEGVNPKEETRNAKATEDERQAIAQMLAELETKEKSLTVSPVGTATIDIGKTSLGAKVVINPENTNDREKTLMGAHNISVDNLRKILKMGGLANPSMAVVDTKHGIHEDYGPISLIPSKRLIDAKQGQNAGTWSADAYSPTYPSSSIVYEISEKDTRSFLQNLPSKTEADGVVKGEIANQFRSTFTDRGRDMFSTNPFKYMFLREKGIDVPISHKEASEQDTRMAGMCKELGIDEKTDWLDLTPEQHKTLIDALTSDYINRSEKDPAEAQRLADKLYRDDADPNKIKRQAFSNGVKRAITTAKRAGEVDTRATLLNASKLIEEQNLTHEFEQWADQMYDGLNVDEKIFDGYTPSGYRRYLPHTLENVSRIMRQQGKAGDEGMHYGMGTSRAKLAPVFKTITEIRRNKDRLIPNEQFEEVKKAFRDEYNELVSLCETERFDPYGNDRLDEAMLSKDPKRYLESEYGIRISEEDNERIKALRTALREMPAPYFETIFQRPVRLDEFEVAVVPDNLDAKLVDGLQKAGLDVRTYKEGDAKDRQRVTMEAAREKDDILFREVEDNDTLDELEKGRTVKVYRAMQVIDGKLYPPMAAVVDGTLVEPAKMGRWYRADERPDLIDPKTGKWKLNKGQGKGVVPAAYNPYFHTSRSPLNDQFSSAYIRPNLVIVECEVPESELTSGYKAEYAKDAVGEMSWHSGSVSGALAEAGNPRKVILSRYAKIVRVVPNSEVADVAAQMLHGVDVEIPYNVVTPQLRAELEKRGITISNEASGTVGQDANFGNAEYVTDEQIGRLNETMRANAISSPEAKRERATTLADRFHVKPAIVESEEELKKHPAYIGANTITRRRMLRSKGFYDPKTGEIVIVLPNNADVEDVTASVFHETVAHHGLRELVGKENYKDFLWEIYGHCSKSVREKINEKAAKKGWDFTKATDEYLGDLAQKNPEDFDAQDRSFWSFIKEKVLNAINKFLGTLKLPKWVSLGDNELRYILWRSAKNLERGKMSAFDVAEDVVKRQELGIGEASRNLRAEKLALEAITENAKQDFPYKDEFVYRKDHPEVTLDDYFKATKATFENLEHDGEYMNISGEWKRMKESGKYEFHKSPKSESEYLIDHSTGDIYRKSTHWGNVASCTWNISNGDKYRYAIGKANIKDFQPRILPEWFLRDTTNNINLRMGDHASTFAERQRRAQEDKGTVMPGLNDAEVTVVEVPRHSYTGDIKEATRQATEAAKAKYVPNGKAVTLDYNNHGASFQYGISGSAIDEALNPKQQNKSSNKGAHLSIIEHLDEIIGESIEVEEHPDYISRGTDGKRTADKANLDALMHRFYGAINIDGQTYRVMTIMREDRRPDKSNGVHAYEVTKVELLDKEPSSSSGTGRLHETVSVAKLLQGVEKSYDKGKNILEESKKADELGDIAFRDGDEEIDVDAILKDKSLGLDERITAVAVGLSKKNSEDHKSADSAMRTISENIGDLKKAMSRQRHYDQSTVKRVADLARILIAGKYMDRPSARDAMRIISAVKNSVGHEDITKHVNKLMDIMLDNQLRNARESLSKLENVKGNKVNAQGVEVQGNLDQAGVTAVKAFKNGRKRSLPELIGYTDADGNNHEGLVEDCRNRMASDNKAIAKQAADEYMGLSLAKKYAERISEIEKEEDQLERELENAKAEYDDGKMTWKQYIELRKEINNSIRDCKAERIEAYQDVARQLSDILKGSVKRANDFKQKEIDRINQIHHYANSDMEGRPHDEHHKDTWGQKIVNSSLVQFFLEPLGTFDQMFRMFGNKSADGEGYLYNHFARGLIDNRGKELTGIKGKFAELDSKAAKLFGKKANWSKLIQMEDKMPRVKVSFMNGGEMKEHELTQGNLMYIYMVNKMTDGRMKLRAMGITEKDVDHIENILDPRFRVLADWLQDEFLVNTRKEYNETHKRLFGASMASIDHYFPLKILSNARVDTPESLDRPEGQGINAVTGSIIKRTRNTLALDLTNADALHVILDHITEMEHWNAFSEWNKDLSILRTYKRFKNQIMNMTSAYGGGKVLWKKFNDLCKLAAGTYQPPQATLDKYAVNVAKGVTGAKVAFRMFTAVKQLFSMPAYIPETNTIYLAQDIANPVGAWKWCKNNLPVFRERWESRKGGDPRLQKTDMDWKLWRTKAAEIASRWGMTLNAFVDAVTVSIGAHSIYRTKKRQYLKDGYSEEQAEKRAKQDATILYNQTQQSSEKMFLSTMQVDRSWSSVLLTVFRNSPMSYTRQQFDALRNLKRLSSSANREKAIEFMTKQFERDGLTHEQAVRAAERKLNRQIRKDIVRTAVFGAVMQLAWNLGAYMPYLIFGDDEEENEKMIHDALIHSMYGSVEGLTMGDVISSGLNMLTQGEWNSRYLEKSMPITSDLMEVLDEMGENMNEAISDLVNLVVQAGIGMNPKSITDGVLAIWDACNGNLETSREAAICILRIINAPQSQIDKIYFDEVGLMGSDAKTLTPVELAERYSHYKTHRERFYAPWSWDDTDKAQKKAERKIKELSGKRFSEQEVNKAYEEYEQMYKKIEAIKTARKELNEVRWDEEKAAFKNKKLQELIEDAGIHDMTNEEKRIANATLENFPDLKKDFDDIVKMFVKAKTTEKAKLAANAIRDYKAAMVDVLNSGGTDQSWERLNHVIDTFYDQYYEDK